MTRGTVTRSRFPPASCMVQPRARGMGAGGPDAAAGDARTSRKAMAAMKGRTRPGSCGVKRWQQAQTRELLADFIGCSRVCPETLRQTVHSARASCFGALQVIGRTIFRAFDRDIDE